MKRLMLLCTIAGRLAAIPTSEVRSVIEIDTVTPVPGTPPYITGLTALRSQALTVIDCRVALGFESAGDPVGSRAAVIALDGHLYALVVDDASDVEEVESEIQQIRGGFGHQWENAAAGMVETPSGPAIVLDIPALLGLRREKAA
ncbi:MAG: chemotaxis protein CheW [Erythrobacter sp.]|nr:chemotaxis protein CheW [Erythrobacter sp.]